MTITPELKAAAQTDLAKCASAFITCVLNDPVMFKRYCEVGDGSLGDLQMALVKEPALVRQQDAELAKAQAEVERLRKALEPFANIEYDELSEELPSFELKPVAIDEGQFTVGDVRRASSAFASSITENAARVTEVES